MDQHTAIQFDRADATRRFNNTRKSINVTLDAIQKTLDDMARADATWQDVDALTDAMRRLASVSSSLNQLRYVQTYKR